MDGLYKELLDENPELKKLEEDLANMESKTNDVTKDFYNYDNKSSAYYNDAIYDLTAIKDSTLQKKLLALLDNSKTQYAVKSAKLKATISQIADNNTQLNDRHTALKIILTLPLIEEFQSKHLPNTNGMTKLIPEQKDLLKQIDSLMHGY